MQRQVVYLGEISDGQRDAWCQKIEAFDEGSQRHRQLALFPADHEIPISASGYGERKRLAAGDYAEEWSGSQAERFCQALPGGEAKREACLANPRKFGYRR